MWKKSSQSDKRGIKNVCISLVTVLNTATLSCQHNDHCSWQVGNILE